MEPQYAITASSVVPDLINKGLSYNDIAIVVAFNAQVRAVSQYLSKEGIPIYLAKWDFENSNVVVWLQDCAQWCISPSSVSFDTLFRTWYSLLRRHNDRRGDFDKIRIKVLFHNLLNEAKHKKSLVDWLEFVINELKLKDTLTNSEEFPNEINNLDILVKEAKLFNLKDAEIERFAKLGMSDNEVTITTRHSAKGLEFEAVILLGMEDGKFPDYRHFGNEIYLEEDQRLCYVCVSRAKKTCVLIRSEYHWVGNSDPWRKPYPPSRFWNALHSKFGTTENTFTDVKFARR